MDGSAVYEVLSEQLLFLGASTIRLVVAFMVLPIFSNELIPALVRNSIFLSLAVIVLLLQPALDATALSSFGWGRMIAKEAFVGLTLGVFFGVYLWAFESAGILIDTQIGASQAQIFDPLSGHEVTLFGEFLGRWANYLFMSAGGLLLLTGAVLNSFVAWPVMEPLPNIRASSVSLFETEFTQYFTLTLMIASPVLVVLFLIDMSMGLINRFAQRLNVLFLSSAIKGLAALLLLIVMFPMLTSLLISELQTHSTGMANYLRVIFHAGS